MWIKCYEIVSFKTHVWFLWFFKFKSNSRICTTTSWSLSTIKVSINKFWKRPIVTSTRCFEVKNVKMLQILPIVNCWRIWDFGWDQLRSLEMNQFCLMIWILKAFCLMLSSVVNMNCFMWFHLLQKFCLHQSKVLSFHQSKINSSILTYFSF